MIAALLARARLDQTNEAAGLTPDPRGVAEEVIASAPLRSGDDAAVEGLWTPIAAGEADMRTALSNLFGNACHYGRGSDGVLRARIIGRPEGSAMVIDVTDGGPGIKDEERGRIFDPFYGIDGGRKVTPD